MEGSMELQRQMLESYEKQEKKLMEVQKQATEQQKERHESFFKQ